MKNALFLASITFFFSSSVSVEASTCSDNCSDLDHSTPYRDFNVLQAESSYAGTFGNRSVGSLNKETGEYKAYGISLAYVYYELENSVTLSNPGDYFSVSYTSESDFWGWAGSSLALFDTTLGRAFVAGNDKYFAQHPFTSGVSNQIDLGISESVETSPTLFCMGSGSDVTDVPVSASADATGFISNYTPYVLTMNISWDSASNQFVGSVAINGVDQEAQVSLGKEVSIDALNLTVFDNYVNYWINISDMKISAHITPEPATVTLSLLGLAALLCRRRRKH